MDGAVVALAGHSPHTAEVAARAFAPTTPQGSSHCAPLPPLAGQNTPADAWERQLNLSPEYLSSVSGFGSLRELVQNWHDECQRHLGGAPSVSRHENEFARITLLFAPGPAGPAPCAGYLLEWRDGAGGFSVQLTNFNTVLKPKILGLGTSEKSGAAAGCFGEGMKVEINRLVARGVGVVVFTGGSRWDFGYRTSEQQGSTLVACATASHFCGHTSFLVSGAEATFAAQLPAAGLSKVDENEFLFLNPPADPAHMKGDLLEVLLEERFYGSLYVNGILVLKDPLVPEFGLNFVGPKTFYPALGFGRDRNVIRAEQLVKLLPWTFYKLADKAHRAKLAFRLCQVLYKHETSQLRHLFGSGAPIKYESDAQETAVQQLLADELVEQFIGNFGLKAFPLNTADASPEEQKQAEYISATPVIVNSVLFGMLTRSQHCPSLDLLWSREAKKILELPDWQPGDQNEQQTAEKFRLRAAEWYGKYIGGRAEQLLFKQFPAGNVTQLVSSAIDDAGAVWFCVDFTLLGRDAVHKWMAQAFGELCPYGQQLQDGSVQCSGSCQMERFQEALQQAIMRQIKTPEEKLRVERDFKRSLFRKETKDLERMIVPPQSQQPGARKPVIKAAQSADAGASQTQSTCSTSAIMSNASTSLVRTLSGRLLVGGRSGADDAIDIATASDGELRKFVSDFGGGDTSAISDRKVLQERAFAAQHRARMLQAPQGQRRSPGGGGGGGTGKGSAAMMTAWTKATVASCLCCPSGGDRAGAPPAVARPLTSGPRFDDNCYQDAITALGNLVEVPYKDEYDQPSAVKLYVQRGEAGPAHRSDGWRAVVMLGKLCTSTLAQGVFGHPTLGLPVSVPNVSIFYEDSGIMAFNRLNRQSDLYFNAYYFERMGHGTDNTAALSFWFTVFCHELGHNTSKDHDLHFSNAVETMTVQFLPFVAALLGAEYIDRSLLG